MDRLFFMTNNRFGQSWMRRMVDAVRADPEGWMMAGRSIGWTDTYNRVADQIAVDAYLESGRAGIAAYVLPDPVTGAGARVIWPDSLYVGSPPPTKFSELIDAEYWAMRQNGERSISDIMRGFYSPPSAQRAMNQAPGRSRAGEAAAAMREHDTVRELDRFHDVCRDEQDWSLFWLIRAQGIMPGPATPGRQRLITLAVRHCWRKP